MSKIIETIKPNIFSSTFMFWGLVSIINILNIHNANNNAFAFLVSIGALGFGITSLIQLAKIFKQLKSSI